MKPKNILHKGSLYTALALMAFTSACSEGTSGTGADFDAALIAELDSAIESEVYRNINGIVVLRDGALVFERYYNGSDETSLHNPRSVGKTFAAAALGIALRDGYIDSLDQTLGEFYQLEDYPNYDPRKSQVTLRELLTMSSGFDGFDFDSDSIGNEENMYPTENWVEWALSLPMATDRNPGEQWLYFTAGAVLLGDILEQTVPGGLEAYSEAELFGPLGIVDYQWQYTPQGVANTAGGLQLSARDFAKFGQLYKNGGTWDGQVILPPAFVADSVSPHFETVNAGEHYGYFLWLKTYRVGDADYPVANASGNGGNKIFVFLDQPLVIAITASAYGQRYAHAQVDEMMEKYIIPATLAGMH